MRLPRLERMNTPSPIRILATHAVASLALLLCATAQAQPVRKCLVDGHVVFQSAPCAVEARGVAAATPATPATPAVDPAAAPKKKNLAELLRERDGADPARPKSREFQADGANLLRSRMGAI